MSVQGPGSQGVGPTSFQKKGPETGPVDASVKAQGHKFSKVKHAVGIYTQCMALQKSVWRKAGSLSDTGANTNLYNKTVKTLNKQAAQLQDIGRAAVKMASKLDKTSFPQKLLQGVRRLLTGRPQNLKHLEKAIKRYNKKYDSNKIDIKKT